MYQPKYVSPEEIPMQIPDDYSESQKRDALETAEASIELDLKDGNELSETEQNKSPIQTAIKLKATCELASGASHPDDTTLGDLEDSGDTKMDYAQRFCDRYNEMVQDILGSDLLDDKESGLGPYVYTTKKP